MALQTCSACRKLIDVEPDVCPVCGATQPDASQGARSRFAIKLAATILCALTGVFVASFAARRGIGRMPPGARWDYRREPQTAGLFRLRERLPSLRADARYPLVSIEDAVADPSRYAGRPAAVVLRLCNLAGRPEHAVVAGLGGLTLFGVDVSGLPRGAVRIVPGGTSDWAVFRGTWRPGALVNREPLHLAAESVETLGPGPSDAVAAALGFSPRR